jgi:hypothetical protein
MRQSVATTNAPVSHNPNSPRVAANFIRANFAVEQMVENLRRPYAKLSTSRGLPSE